MSKKKNLAQDFAFLLVLKPSASKGRSGWKMVAGVSDHQAKDLGRILVL